MPFNRFEQAFGLGGGQSSPEGKQPKLRKDGQPKQTGRWRKGIETEKGKATREQEKKMKEMRARQRQQRAAEKAGRTGDYDAVPQRRYKPGLSRKDRSGGR